MKTLKNSLQQSQFLLKRQTRGFTKHDLHYSYIFRNFPKVLGADKQLTLK